MLLLYVSLWLYASTKNTDWAHFTHLMQELLLSSKILKSHKHAFCKASL
ncbi:Hypothetical protein BN2458_PEG0877 [Helicobacter typhlonius]|uniref:Uncharacterized protein n=1 Tax=Helicobacter typhlonius TaxID=76936 RepID=A0A0S4PX33_9HELI|nr:Hypothetical protein BN2458_PEG0877 [Helicobacter typhlonius]